MEEKEKDFLFKLGRKIEALYLEKYPSQNAFAKAVDCDNRTIRRIIRGEQNVSVLILMRIAEALEIELIELLNI